MIMVIGSINLDFSSVVMRLPKWGETVQARGSHISPGGKGANQALAARLAGARVEMAGAVGDDHLAGQALENLRAADVDLSGIDRVQDQTGTAQIITEVGGTNLIVVSPGANAKLTPDKAAAAVARLSPRDTLMLQLEIPLEAVEAALAQARKQGVRTILNAAPFVDDVIHITPLADTTIVNEIEFGSLTGADDLEGSASYLAAARDYALARRCNLIVTLGSNGAAACINGGVFTVPAPKIDPLDTVAAGDTFCGYYAAGLDLGGSARESVRQAVDAGALACLRTGAQVSIPSRLNLEAWLRREGGVSSGRPSR